MRVMQGFMFFWGGGRGGEGGVCQVHGMGYIQRGGSAWSHRIPTPHVVIKSAGPMHIP